MHANDNLDALPINVVFHWGASPRADGACAQAGLTTSWNTVVGGTITIWEQWGQGASAHLRGQLCTYNWGGLIAHEIGHILGLANTGCADHIMGPDWSRLSGPASGECANVNVKWTTPEAQKEMCDLSCSAGECIAGPAAGPRWVCPQTSGDGGGDDGGDPGCTFGACSPLVLDLNGDGIHTTSVATDPVFFDLSGDGVLDVVGWTNPNTEEALLYYDHNGNGVIDGGAELFGEVTVMPDGRRAQNGFEALAAYDHPAYGGDGDGSISPSDGIWGRMRLWVDRNQDGLMTNDENLSLGQGHVAQLHLGYGHATADESYGVDDAGNFHYYQGTFLQRSGKGQANTLRALHDVYFAVRPLTNTAAAARASSARATANRTSLRARSGPATRAGADPVGLRDHVRLTDGERQRRSAYVRYCGEW